MRWNPSSLLRWMQGNATLHTATVQPISRQQLQTSLLKRAKERWFCKTVMSHDSDDTLLTSEEPEDIKHNFFPPLKTDENEVRDVLYRYGNQELFATLETKSGTHDSLVEVQSREICNILLSSGKSSIQDCLQPFVKHLSPCLVVRVLNQLTNVEMEKFFFYWAAKQDGYKHNIFVYNTLLMKLVQAKAKHFDAIWKLLKEMQSEDCNPTSTTFAIIIQNCREADTSQQCWKAFEEAERLGVMLDAHIYTALMHVLFDRRDVAKAKWLFGKMMECHLELDVHIWFTVIHGLCKNKNMAAAEIFFNQMQTSGCMPNDDIYNAMILGFCELSDPMKALSIYDLMQKQDAGCELNLVTFNILLERLLEKGKTMEAAKLFSKMHDVGLVDSSSYRIYTSSIKRLGGESKLIAFSEKLFSKYGTCDVEVCNVILQYYCELGELSKASKYLDETFVRLSAPNEFSYILMIEAFCKSGDVNAARSLLSRMDERGCQATDMSYEPVVIALCKHFRASEALQLFEDMNAKGLETSSTTCKQLLETLSDAGLVDAVIRLCDYIIERRHVITRVTAFSFVKCLSRSNRQEEAFVLLRAMTKHGCFFKSSTFIYALTSMMRGEIDEDEVEKYAHKQLPSILSYSAMLSGACRRSQLNKAVSIFSHMEERGCLPDAKCYNMLILALSKSRKRLMESTELFEEMLERGMAPFRGLQSTLMNTLCRAKKQDLIMKFGKLIIAKGLTVERGTVFFLLEQDDKSELKKLYFELNDNNCLAESVARKCSS